MTGVIGALFVLFALFLQRIGPTASSLQLAPLNRRSVKIDNVPAVSDGNHPYKYPAVANAVNPSPPRANPKPKQGTRQNTLK